jgi:hypothetical protein
LTAIPSKQDLSDAPIHLDHDHDAVRSFLDLLGTSSSTEVSVNLSNCDALLSLSDMFGTPRVERDILRTLRSSLKPDGGKPPIDAWDAFKIAARRDDVELAVSAIWCFELSGHTLKQLLTGNPPSFFDNIPPNYVYALMRSAFDSGSCSQTGKCPTCERYVSLSAPRAVQVLSAPVAAHRFSLD